MSEVPPERPMLTQATGRAADVLVGGFAGSPALLLIVVLNVAMILTGGYYMLQQDRLRNEVNSQVIGLMEKCILHTSPIERQQGTPP